ncbi:MAG: prepilin-type N-terminal cleavage/methylation domain-containing protein [Actinobacteria bacterium]|nr:prepilin-type N-terminal cleavage/methylation domain-containing protein [Actinomycetota bacterium]
MTRRLAGQDGFTLVEMLAVLAIMGFVIGGIAGLLTSGARYSYDSDARVLSEQNTRMALDRLEYEARCASYASTASLGAAASSVTLTFPSSCNHTSGTYATWCVSGGTLTRYSGTSCSGSGIAYIKSITSATPFSVLWATNQDPRLQLNLTVNGGGSSDASSITDAISIRNAAEALGSLSSTSGAVGSSVTITGTGFEHGATLSITFGSVAATVTSGGTVTSTGAFSTVFTVPFSGNGAYNVVVSDGVNTLTASSQYTVTGSFDGLGWTSTTHSGAASLSCGTITQSNTCTFAPLGGTGNYTGKITFETAAGAAVTNTSGGAYSVSVSCATVSSPGASCTSSAGSIANGASATTSAFQMTGLGAGWKSTMTNTVVVNGITYTLATTGW